MLKVRVMPEFEDAASRGVYTAPALSPVAAAFAKYGARPEPLHAWDRSGVLKVTNLSLANECALQAELERIPAVRGTSITQSPPPQVPVMNYGDIGPISFRSMR